MQAHYITSALGRSEFSFSFDVQMDHWNKEDDVNMGVIS